MKARLLTGECWSGFVASGPLVVLAEAALRMGSKPSYIQQMLLFQLVAGLTLAGSPTTAFPLYKSTLAVNLQLTCCLACQPPPCCLTQHL